MPDARSNADDAATPDGRSILALVETAFAAANAGDLRAFQDTWTDPIAAIINEAPPHLWTGERVLERWLADNMSSSPAGTTKMSIALKRFVKLTISDDHALLFLIVTVTREVEGELFIEDGAQISTLQRTDGSWRVAALAYASGTGL